MNKLETVYSEKEIMLNLLSSVHELENSYITEQDIENYKSLLKNHHEESKEKAKFLNIDLGEAIFEDVDYKRLRLFGVEFENNKYSILFEEEFFIEKNMMMHKMLLEQDNEIVGPFKYCALNSSNFEFMCQRKKDKVKVKKT